jgi:tRNA(Ile2)-agmatinylcytidine synthase
VIIVGIDDTDSTSGMCTTYLAAMIFRKLNVVGTPRLVRLNPNIPFKTRGNGAVSFMTDDEPSLVKETVISHVESYSVFEDDRTNPGVAFISGDVVPKPLKDFYKRAVSELVSIDDAKEAARAAGADIRMFKNGRGIIGALAAIGFHGPVTYESIAYRQQENFGRRRMLDPESVREMDRKLWPRVFDNIGPDGKKVVLAPHGLDPILCGIRGVTREAVESGWSMVRSQEPVSMVQVFETNQGTDAHLRQKAIADIRPYDCVRVVGVVSGGPKTIAGGHVIFRISDSSGSIDCASYRKSGDFGKEARKLAIGDSIIASGGVGKYPQTLNLEKLQVLGLAITPRTERPICCGRNMTSAGAGKGFKCKKCGKKVSQTEVKVSQGSRGLLEGIYEAPSGARRHLSRPSFLDKIV